MNRHTIDNSHTEFDAVLSEIRLKHVPHTFVLRTKTVRHYLTTIISVPRAMQTLRRWQIKRKTITSLARKTYGKSVLFALKMKYPRWDSNPNYCAWNSQQWRQLWEFSSGRQKFTFLRTHLTLLRDYYCLKHFSIKLLTEYRIGTIILCLW